MYKRLAPTVLAKICFKAADILERDGWRKGSIGDDDGPKCAMGALNFARYHHVHEFVDVNQITDLFLRTRPRCRRSDIVAFNDAARTRKHDVLELLRDMGTTASV